MKHEVLEQTRAPGSKVANLDIAVRGICEVWLEDMAGVLHNAQLLDRAGSGVATFVVNVHSFI